MNKGAETKIKSNIGLTDSFRVRVGVHQMSALISFLFISLLDDAPKNQVLKALSAILFADGIVLARDSLKKLESDLEMLVNALGKTKLSVEKKREFVVFNFSC